MKLLSLLLILLALATAASAQTRPGPHRAPPNYPVAIGPGLSTCAQFEHLHYQDPSMADAYFVWAEGYLSGLDDHFIDDGVPADILPPNLSNDDQKKFLDEFCRAHPDAPYMQGVAALFALMRRQQGIGDAPAAPNPAAARRAH